MRRKILLSWSSGKDSAWCLHLLRQDPYAARFEVAGLLTTFNEAFDRVAMHSVRRGIVIAQAEKRRAAFVARTPSLAFHKCAV